MHLRLAAVLLALLLVTVGCLAGPFSNADGQDPSTETSTPSPTDHARETTSPTDEGDGTSTPTATTATASPNQSFGFSIDDIADCGETCRDVTATLTNERRTAVRNVTVELRVFVGNTTEGEPLWTDEEAVDRLESNESEVVTRRVELSLSDALTVEQHDGWVTIEATIRSPNGTMTTTRQRQVT